MTDVNMETAMKDAFDGIKAVQDKFDEVKGKVDALDGEMIKKAADDASKAIEQLNELKAAEKFKDMQDRVDFLEGKVARSDGAVEEANEEFKHAFQKYLRKGVDIDSEQLEVVADKIARKHLFGAEDREIEMFKKDLVAGSGPDGGYFISADRYSTMIERIFETSPLRGVANIETTTSDVFEYMLDDDEADCGWVGEVDARPDTNTPQVGIIKIPVHEVYAQPKATQKMLDDAGFNIEAWLNRKVSSRIGRKENTAFVSGDGSQKPKGFLSYSAWSSAGTYQRDAVEQITSGTSGSFGADDIIDLKNALIEDYQTNATFGMKRATFTDVMKLKDTEGQYLLNPQMLMQGADKVLMGSSVVFMDDIPDVASNALAMVCADFSEFYTIVDRFDIRVLRDPYTQKPYVKFYTTKRTGGAVTNFEAGKILKIAA